MCCFQYLFYSILPIENLTIYKQMQHTYTMPYPKFKIEGYGTMPVTMLFFLLLMSHSQSFVHYPSMPVTDVACIIDMNKRTWPCPARQSAFAPRDIAFPWPGCSNENSMPTMTILDICSANRWDRPRAKEGDQVIALSSTGGDMGGLKVGRWVAVLPKRIRVWGGMWTTGQMLPSSPPIPHGWLWEN